MKRTFEAGSYYLKLLRWLQSKCQHPSYAVKADIHEGDIAGRQVQWCEICGAFRFARFMSHWIPEEWREPRPDWYTPKERKEYLQALRESE